MLSRRKGKIALPPVRQKKIAKGPLIIKGIILFFFLAVLGLIWWAASIWYFTDSTRLMSRRSPANALDGSGFATITPDVVRAGEELDSYKITFIAGPGGIKQGGRITLVYPGEIVAYGKDFRVYIPYLATDSIKWFMDVPIEAETGKGAELEVTSLSWLGRLRLFIGFYKPYRRNGVPTFTFRDLARELASRSIIVKSGEIAPGQEIDITVGGKKPLKAPRYANWTSFITYVDGDGDGVALPLPASPRVITTGAKATGFRVVASSTPKTWEVMKVTVSAIDDDGQIDTGYKGTVYLDAPDVALPGSTEFELSNLGQKTFYARMTREGVYFIVARDPQGRRGRSNPIVVEQSGLHLYWGDLHIHSVLDIGNNIPEWVLRTARDDLSLDFACLPLMDQTIPFKSHSKFPGIFRDPFAWGHVRYISTHFNETNNFAVLKGFEWADSENGYRGIYYSPDVADPQILPHALGHYDTVEKLLRALKGHKAIVVPHHPAWRGGRFMGDTYNWGSRDDSFQRLVEVYSSDGASEYYDNPYPIHNRNAIEDYTGSQDQAGKRSGAFARDAFAQGYKLGMIAGGDMRYDMDRPASYKGGLTAVWAPSLTADNIWNSLYSRRVYATTGARIYIKFMVGGASPGNELAVDVPTPIYLYIVGTAPIKEAQVIKYDDEYKVYRSFKSQNEVIRTSWSDSDPPPRGFYYLRVTQEDGEMAWAGPIWVYRR